jgi:hypothetical protein
VEELGDRIRRSHHGEVGCPMTSSLPRLIAWSLVDNFPGEPVNLTRTGFVEDPQVPLLDGLRRQFRGVIAGDSGAFKDRDEAVVDRIVGELSVQLVVQPSIVRICRGLP